MIERIISVVGRSASLVTVRWHQLINQYVELRKPLFESGSLGIGSLLVLVREALRYALEAAFETACADCIFLGYIDTFRFPTPAFEKMSVSSYITGVQANGLDRLGRSAAYMYLLTGNTTACPFSHALTRAFKITICRALVHC